MPFVPAVNTLMAEIRCLWDNQRVENTLYFNSVAPWSTSSMTTLANDLITWWSTKIAPRVSDDVTLSEVFVTDLTTATSPTVSVVPGTPLTGARVSPSMPNSVTLAISFRTAGRGRSSRGRNFILGITEDQVTGNNFLSSEAALYVTAYEDLFTAFGTLGAVWVVVSRFTNGAPRTTALVQDVTSVIIVDTVIDSQRRRLPGRGN